MLLRTSLGLTQPRQPAYLGIGRGLDCIHYLVRVRGNMVKAKIWMTMFTVPDTKRALEEF